MSIAVNLFQQTVPVEQLVEDLVALRAKKAEIDKQVKNLEAIFKNDGECVYNSHYHTINIGAVHSNPVNWKGLATDAGYSDYFLKKHTGSRTTLRLTISAKKKEAA